MFTFLLVNGFLNSIRPTRWIQRQNYGKCYFSHCVFKQFLFNFVVDNFYSRNRNVGVPFIAGSCFTQERLPGKCQPLATCFYQYDNLEQVRANYCPLGQNNAGVCCPTHVYRSTQNGLFL